MPMSRPPAPAPGPGPVLGRRRDSIHLDEALLQHIIYKMILHLTLHHVHSLFSEDVDSLVDRVLDLVRFDAAGLEFMDEVV